MEIRIGVNPNLIDTGWLTVTWHGFLTFVAVALAVIIIRQLAKKDGITTDAVYSVAVWCIIGGIIGARALHVVDFWRDVYWHEPERIIQVWEGGITIYGAILGGFLSGAAYMIIRNHPRFLALWGKYFRWAGEPKEADLPSVGRLADIAVPGLLIAMMIGRVGDIINGEHFANLTSLAWGLVYTHPDTVGLYARQGLYFMSPAAIETPATHPVIAYEMLLDLTVLGVVWLLRDRLRPDGMLFALYLGLYSMGRFFLSFLRFDKDWLVGLNEAQFVALVVLAIVVPLLAYRAQFVRPIRPEVPPGRTRARP